MITFWYICGCLGLNESPDRQLPLDHVPFGMDKQET